MCLVQNTFIRMYVEERWNVQSDHKSLEAIMKKPLSCAPARIRRLLMRLQKYPMNVQYKPGKEMHIADALSRAYLAVTGTPD